MTDKTTPQRTALYPAHVDAGAKLVDFSGWELPINYGSQIEEHHSVRTDAGMFDVSHMVVTDVAGDEAKHWLAYLLANDIHKLKTVGKALYSAILNEQGGVIDDLIVYRLNQDETQYRIVSNAATRDKDLTHFQDTIDKKGFKVTITERPELAMLAIQGPHAIDKLKTVKPDWAETLDKLSPFVGADMGDDWFVARTGYTGEDGIEVILPETAAVDFFNRLKDAGVTPAGLGARDTLRLEAGMNLYGHDMDDTISPYEANMAWTLGVKDDRDFVGRTQLLAKRQQSKADGTDMKQVGLLLESRGVLREGMTVHVANSDKEGVITSGTFSPTLKQSIAIARVPASIGETAQVDIRGKSTEVRVLKLPFVRMGQKQFETTTTS